MGYSRTSEFVVVLSQRLFPSISDWTNFLADSRRTVVNSILQLDTFLSADSAEFWGWHKADASARRVSFRAPAEAKATILAASGVHVPFIISELCRSQADNDARDQFYAVVLLAKRPYGESLVLLKQVGEHLHGPGPQFAAFWHPCQTISACRSSHACLP